MSDRNSAGALSGRRIALPESRELDRLARMLEEQGAETLRCPLIAITDAPDPAPVREWLTRLPFDDLVLFTGKGLRRLRRGSASRRGFSADCTRRARSRAAPSQSGH
jgi:uroporphyrinogen-III synthase